MAQNHSLRIGQSHRARLYDQAGQPIVVAGVAWTSSVPAVATVDPATGVVTPVSATAQGGGLSPGQTTITGTLGGVSQSFVLQVINQVPTSASLLP